MFFDFFDFFLNFFNSGYDIATYKDEENEIQPFSDDNETVKNEVISQRIEEASNIREGYIDTCYKQIQR